MPQPDGTDDQMKPMYEYYYCNLLNRPGQCWVFRGNLQLLGQYCLTCNERCIACPRSCLLRVEEMSLLQTLPLRGPFLRTQRSGAQGACRLSWPSPPINCVFFGWTTVVTWRIVTLSGELWQTRHDDDRVPGACVSIEKGQDRTRLRARFSHFRTLVIRDWSDSCCLANHWP